MPITITINARTGERKTFWLDSSFGIDAKRLRNGVCATRTQPVYEVRWSSERHGLPNRSQKFDNRETAIEFFSGRHRRRMRPEWVHHASGVHDKVL